MSRQLLENLNGNKTGKLKEFLDNLKNEPRIAWYPSAGQDFCSLLNLHASFSQLHPASAKEPKHPELFLFTDYYPPDEILNNSTFYPDSKTTVHFEHIEELPRLNLPLHSEMVIHSPFGKIATGNVIFLIIKIVNDQIGSVTFPVIYAFVENESFYCKKLIPNKATITHILHVRYGGGCGGGGYASGGWILNVLKKLNCELFISDGDHSWQSGDYFALELCPSIPKECNAQLTPIRVIPSEMWSNHGDVSWNIVT